MTHVIEARRRLILSIIRAPTLSHQISPVAKFPVQTRLFHNADPRRSNNANPSISFGPRIDGLLDSGKRSRKSTFRKGRNIGGEPSVTATRNNVDDLSVKASTTPRTSKKRVNIQTTGRENRPAQQSGQPTVIETDHAGSVEVDPVLLELSGDAYDTISEPGVKTSYNRGRISVRPTRQDRGIERSPATSGIPQRHGATPTKDNHPNTRSLKPTPKLEPWRIQKDALSKKFGEEGWNPRKRLSPDAMEGIRAMHEEDPERYTTEILSQQFKVSPEAIRRMLRSKWRPSPELMDDRRRRWARRHDRIWDHKAALGLRPPRTSDKQPEGPEAFEEEVYAKRMLGNL